MPAKPNHVVTTFSNPYFKELVRRWRRMVRSEPEKDLSNKFRRELAQATLGYTFKRGARYDRTAFAEDIVKKASEMRPPFTAAPSKTSRSPLTVRTIKKSFDIESQACTWLPVLLRMLQDSFGGEDPIFENEFNNVPFKGPNAPFVFCRRLLGLPPMHQWFGIDVGRRGRFDASSAERKALLTTVERFLDPESTRSTADHPTKPCLVVYSDQAPRGLNALTVQLMTQGLEAPQLGSAPRCLLSVSPHAPPYKNVDLPMLLDQMLAFYAGGTVMPRSVAMSDAAVREGLAKVRRFMSQYPATFIFDGVVDYGEDYPDLRASMVDDPFAFLIEHLLLPDLGSVDDPASLEIFRRNRFLILADGPCKWLTPHLQGSEPLPDADKAFLADILVRDQLHYPAGPLKWDRTEEQPTFANGEKLRAYFLAQDAPEAADESTLQFIDALLQLKLQVRQLPPPEQAARKFVDQLSPQHDSWVLPLLFLVITPGGLFHQTLLDLLAAWGRHRPESLTASHTYRPDTLHLRLTATQDAAGIADLCGDLSSMLSSTVDETVLDLHASGRPGDRLSINFKTPGTAKRLAAALLPRIAPEDLLLAHSLLAEESLLQHTRLMRYGERDDHSSLRENRRLIQALYHGVLSVDPAASPPPAPFGTTLPAEAGERLRRLYAMFYRLLLEAPPHWEMSRGKSAEGVKRDLLLSFLDTDRSPHARSTPTEAREGVHERVASEKATPAWLLAEAAANPASRKILNDLLFGICQASLQLNDFTGFDSGLARARLALDQLLPGDGIEEHAALDKLAIDAAILRNQHRLALTTAREGLRRLGWPEAALERAAGELRDGFFPPEVALSQAIGPIRPSVASRATSFLERWAEVLATRADLQRHYKLSDAATEEGDDAPGELGSPTLLRDAYILFALADQTRRISFGDDPFGRGFVLSGHATRLHIRALALRYRQCEDEHQRERLMRLAHRRANTLTRVFARYPAERASMLILESILVRMPDPSRTGLRAAFDYLLDADRQMTWATDRPRLKMRLLLERAKVLRRLARLGGAQARDYQAWARSDGQRLSALAAESGSPLWIMLAQRVLRKGERSTAEGGDALG